MHCSVGGNGLQVIDARLREADTELAAARRLLREAGAERELLRHRLEEARLEMENLLQGYVQASVFVFVEFAAEALPHVGLVRQFGKYSTQLATYIRGRRLRRD